MYRTRVGYTGGRKKFPTYDSLGNHTEALQIDFEPTQISFADIVDIFWKTHDPRCGIRSSQYMTAIWFHDDTQRDIINAAKESIEVLPSEKVQTPVMPLDVFYPAEDYHQKYCLQNSPLRSHFRAMYPKFDDFKNSTAAARLNGFIAGEGSSQLYDEEHQNYGFQTEDLKRVIRLREPSGGAASCSNTGCTSD